MAKCNSVGIKNLIIDIKQLIKRNKLIFIIGIVAFVLGMICAFMKLEEYCENYDKSNILLRIKEKDFNVILAYLKITFYITIMFALGYLLSINFYLFFCNYIALLLMVRQLFLWSIASCVVDGFSGIVVLILFWLPLIVVGVFVYLCYLANIFEIIENQCKKTIIPYSMTIGCAKKYFKTNYLFLLILSLVYSSIIFLLFTIFT